MQKSLYHNDIGYQLYCTLYYILSAKQNDRLSVCVLISNECHWDAKTISRNRSVMSRHQPDSPKHATSWAGPTGRVLITSKGT